MAFQKWITSSAGVKMPCVIYGTAWKKERTADLVVKAVEAGFRGVDTACQPKHYNEPLVGEALQRLKGVGIDRDMLYLQTKFTPLSSQDPDQVPYDKHSTPQLQVAESFEVSKRNLKTDYVDCFILHSPMATHAQTMQAWRAMERIHAAGGTRQLGISNCYDINVLKALYNDADVKPVVIQNRFYKDTGYDADLRQWCAEHRMIYQSFWTLTANKHVLDSDTVQKLARQYGKTEAQLFFRFLHQCGIVPLTGTCSAQHMREDLDIFEFELSVDELADVNRLLT